jgi:hypothetical protein
MMEPDPRVSYHAGDDIIVPSIYRRFNATSGSTLIARRVGAAAAMAATAHSVIATHASVAHPSA